MFGRRTFLLISLLFFSIICAEAGESLVSGNTFVSSCALSEDSIIDEHTARLLSLPDLHFRLTHDIRTGNSSPKNHEKTLSQFGSDFLFQSRATFLRVLHTGTSGDDIISKELFILFRKLLI